MKSNFGFKPIEFRTSESEDYIKNALEIFKQKGASFMWVCKIQ